MTAIDNVLKENENLKKEVAQHKNNFSIMQSQVESHKQALNESISGSLNLRTNMIIFQKQAQEANAKIQTLEKTIAGLNKQLTDATAKIAELSAPPVIEGETANATDQVSE